MALGVFVSGQQCRHLHKTHFHTKGSRNSEFHLFYQWYELCDRTPSLLQSGGCVHIIRHLCVLQSKEKRKEKKVCPTNATWTMRSSVVCQSDMEWQPCSRSNFPLPAFRPHVHSGGPLSAITTHTTVVVHQNRVTKIGRQLIYYTEFSKQPNSHPWCRVMGHLISAASLQL